MDSITTSFLLTQLIIIVAIVGFFMNQSKRIDKIFDTMAELKERVTKLESNVDKVLFKLDIYDEKISVVKEQNVATNKRIDKVESELKVRDSKYDLLEDNMRETMNRVLDILPKQPAL
jgi:uncharacterized coiled-coil DUF342 family protein